MPSELTACTKGTKARFKASGVEFEIVATTASTSTIRYHWQRVELEVEDVVLKRDAVEIKEWGEKWVLS